MSDNRNLEMTLDGNMSRLEFLQSGEYASDYALWCNNHGVPQDDKSAEFYFDMAVETETEQPMYMYFS